MNVFKNTKPARAKTYMQYSFVLACAMAISMPCWSFSLGEAKVNTKVGEKLSAVIDIQDENDRFRLEDLSVRQLSREQASILGINLAADEKFFSLKPINENGDFKIEVSTDSVVDQPYLNFVVELLWPKGRVFREYTLLLNAANAVQQTQTSAPPNINSNAVSTSSQLNDIIATPASQSPGQVTPVGKVKYTVRKGDNLSRIAQRNKSGTGMTRVEMMEWILNNNIESFVNGNPNLLISGAELLLPAGPQQPSERKSIVDGKTSTSKNLSTQVGRSFKELNSNAATQNDSRLTVESGTANNQRPATSINDAGELQQRLNMSKENLAQLKRENQELMGRLERLENGDYLKNLERLVSLKDQQIKVLNEQIDELIAVDESQTAALSPDGKRNRPIESEQAQQSSLSFAGFVRNNKVEVGFIALISVIALALIAAIARMIYRDKEIDFDDPSTYPVEIKRDPAEITPPEENDFWGSSISDDNVELTSNYEQATDGDGAAFYEEPQQDNTTAEVDELIELAMIKARNGEFSEAKLLLLRGKELFSNDERIDEALEFITAHEV